MNRMSHTSIRVALVVATLAFSGSAFAQATRTWVSGVGDDVNPCSRTAPCKTFAGAISKTAAGGEISVLDPAGYGAVTITKSITISGDGTLASILHSATTGIIVNAAPTDVVTIRNVSLHGGGNGIHGIRFLAGAALNVENVTIQSVTGRGIEFTPSGGAELHVKYTTIDRAASGGIAIQPGVSGSATAVLDNVSLVNNGVGLRVEARSSATVNRSTIAGNTNNGVLVLSTANVAQASISDSSISGNGSNVTTAGVKVEGGGARAFLAENTISNNFIGLLTTNGGTILSYGNNWVAGNGTDGNASGIIAGR